MLITIKCTLFVKLNEEIYVLRTNYLNTVIMEMLDHQKMVLLNVSKDTNLFRKELRKSLHWLSNPEKGKLYLWLTTNFGDDYQELISEAYLKSA